MKTINLIHTVTQLYNNGNNKITVKIRLNDECNNGHQDFSITADLWEKYNGKMKDAGGGCCHDEILKVFPEFKIFTELHLCDYLGNPMYADANGFYHLKEGMQGGQTFAEYYGMTEEQYNVVKIAEDQKHYNYLIRKSGVVKAWRAKAKKAIKLIEALTGDEFENNSTRTQFTPNSKSLDAKLVKRIKEGYYTVEKIADRETQKAEEKRQKQINDLKKEAKTEIGKIKTELNLNLYILKCGLSIDNFIYYNHTNKGVFNWSGSSYYDKTSENDFNMFTSHLDFNKLPKGIVFELKGIREFGE